MEVSALETVFLFVAGALGVGGLTPVVDRALELAGRERASRLDESLLRLGELFRRGISRRKQKAHGGRGHLARRERLRGRRHGLERSRHTDVTCRGRVRHAMPMRKPGRHRSVTVDGEGASSLELGQAPRAFGLDDPGRALQLVEIGRESVVREEAEILDAELVQRRTKRAHESDNTERVFEPQ
ncbi:MAG: hypothetical protein WD834_06270 [Actinomycetota bacterium]